MLNFAEFAYLISATSESCMVASGRLRSELRAARTSMHCDTQFSSRDAFGPTTSLGCRGYFLREAGNFEQSAS